jgi:hypothetical protein
LSNCPSQRRPIVEIETQLESQLIFIFDVVAAPNTGPFPLRNCLRIRDRHQIPHTFMLPSNEITDIGAIEFAKALKQGSVDQFEPFQP